MTTRRELVEKVTALVARRYAGDWLACFRDHDENGDGVITRDELTVILARAGVGWRASRWVIAEQVIEVIDGDSDDAISFAEFTAITGIA